MMEYLRHLFFTPKIQLSVVDELVFSLLGLCVIVLLILVVGVVRWALGMDKRNRTK